MQDPEPNPIVTPPEQFPPVTTPTLQVAPGVTRQPGEVSWRSVLIVPDRLRELLAKSGEQDKRVQTVLAEDAIAYGYPFVCIGNEVFEVIPPDENNRNATLRKTQVTVENNEFVVYVIVNKNLEPLSMNGHMLQFINPEVAKLQALRNAGEVLRLEEFIRRKTTERSNLIIPGR